MATMLYLCPGYSLTPCTRLHSLPYTKIPSTFAIRSCKSPAHQITAVELECNAKKAKRNPSENWGYSLGIDLGNSNTGVAVSCGFCPRPLTVLHLRGQKLETQLLELAENEEADEFIVGLPKSLGGCETTQSNIVRSIAGRLAVRAAEKGWRVYLQDEYGTSEAALDLMIKLGLKQTARRNQLDSYAAMVLLQRYFSTSGHETELVWPKDTAVQQKLIDGMKERAFEDF